MSRGQRPCGRKIQPNHNLWHIALNGAFLSPFFFFQHYKAALQYFRQSGSNARCTWQRNVEIEAPGSSVYHRQRQNQTAKEAWNLERKLQIDEPNSGGRQACQVRVTVWRWNVHTSHNHIPACWLQLTTLFQSREDCLDLPTSRAGKRKCLPSLSWETASLCWNNVIICHLATLSSHYTLSSNVLIWFQREAVTNSRVGTKADVCDWLQVVMSTW